MLKTREEFDVAMMSHIQNYLAENPIYQKLKLTQEQMAIFVEEEIMPRFKEEYEFESLIMKQWFKLDN